MPEQPYSFRPRRNGRQADRSSLLSFENVHIHFPVRGAGSGRGKEAIRAVDGVTFDLSSGESLALVGESGAGKTTIGYAAIGHYKPNQGRISLLGEDLGTATRDELRNLRRDVQMIYQDPYSAINPRMRVGEVVGEPLVAHGIMRRGSELRNRVADLLNMVEMPRDVLDRLPGEFSGGQRQRLVIARALALQPRLVVADEPTSALDVSVQASIINLLSDLQEELGLTYLFISHDLAVVRQIASRIAVMYAGRLVESGPTEDVFNAPLHPYTQALLSAIPVPDPHADWRRNRINIDGEVPSPIHPPSGCRFADRCPLVIEKCRTESPLMTEELHGHWASCWRASEWAGSRMTSDGSDGAATVDVAVDDRFGGSKSWQPR